VVTVSLPGAGDATAKGPSVVTVERLSTTAYRLRFELDRRADITIEYEKTQP
jgi:hypothetical protein